MSEKRRDNKGRILKNGESQKPRGRHRRCGQENDFVRKNPFNYALNTVIEDDRKPWIALTEEQEDKVFNYERRYISMIYIIRIIQVSTLLGGVEFMLMLFFGDLTESVKPVVLGAVLASLIIFGVLDIIDKKLASKRNEVSSTLS